MERLRKMVKQYADPTPPVIEPFNSSTSTTASVQQSSHGQDKLNQNQNGFNSGFPSAYPMMPQQSIHIQPQFAAETADPTALIDALRDISATQKSLVASTTARVESESSKRSNANELEMELWMRKTEIAKLHKDMSAMSKAHSEKVAGLRKVVEEREKEIARLTEKARKLRSAYEEARRDGFQSEGCTGSSVRVQTSFLTSRFVVVSVYTS